MPYGVGPPAGYQHTDSAGPAFLAAGEIRLLLVEKLAGSSVANLNHDVVISLGDFSRNPDKRLFGPSCNAMPASHRSQFSQRLPRHGLRVEFTYVNDAVPSGVRQLPTCLLANFVHSGRTTGGLAQ